MQLQHGFRHDGYYQRISFGPQYLAISGTRMGVDASLTGFSYGISLAVGGTPLRGLAIGGMFGLGSIMGKPQGAPPEATGNAYLTAGLLAPFVDWYPQERGPWHLGAAIGLGVLSGTDGASNVFAAIAPGGTLFGGYDCWIGPQFSLGMGLVASGNLPADTREHGPDLGYRLGAFALGFQSSLVWH